MELRDKSFSVKNFIPEKYNREKQNDKSQKRYDELQITLTNSVRFLNLFFSSKMENNL